MLCDMPQRRVDAGMTSPIVVMGVLAVLVLQAFGDSDHQDLVGDEGDPLRHRPDHGAAARPGDLTPRISP